MKYIIIILSFMLFISSELLANSLVGKGLKCGKNLYIYFNEEDKYHSYSYEDYEIKYITYKYSVDLNLINLKPFYWVNRKTLEYGLKGLKEIGTCELYSKREIIDEMNKVIDKAKSENKL